jgi:hypothetical protein
LLLSQSRFRQSKVPLFKTLGELRLTKLLMTGRRPVDVTHMRTSFEHPHTSTETTATSDSPALLVSVIHPNGRNFDYFIQRLIQETANAETVCTFIIQKRYDHYVISLYRREVECRTRGKI